jgi:hypothetical protein
MSLNFAVLTVATILPGFIIVQFNIVMCEEFRVAKMAVKFESRRLTLQKI